MSRNYGLGSRNMYMAGRFALNNSVKNRILSFATASVVAERWRLFALWAVKNGVKKMERITRELVVNYGKDLVKRIDGGVLSVATAHVYVSAINTVMSIALGAVWEKISPTRDCGIPQRCAVRKTSPGGLNQGSFKSAIDAVCKKYGGRLACVVALMRVFGLRSKEASLINAKRAFLEAVDYGEMTVGYGTKGGRERKVPVNTKEKIELLKNAAIAQANDFSMIPADTSWMIWQRGSLKAARKIVRDRTSGGLHDLRAAYACERYAEITGNSAPAAGGKITDMQLDFEARKIISAELGHNRIDVVAEYVGGRR